MKDATAIHVTLRTVTVDADVASSPARLRAEIAAGIARALARPANAAAERPGSLGARVGRAVAARLAEHGLGDARIRAHSDGGRDGQ